MENDGVIKGASGLLFLLVIVDITSMEHDWLYLKDRALILMGDGEFVKKRKIECNCLTLKDKCCNIECDEA